MAVVEASPLRAAWEHHDLGLPLPPGTRWRMMKSLVIRIARLFLHRQLAFNRAVVDTLAQLHTAVEQLTGQVVASEGERARAAAESGVRLQESLDRFAQRMELMQRQTFALHHEGVGEVRADLVESQLAQRDLAAAAGSLQSTVAGQRAQLDGLQGEMSRLSTELGRQATEQGRQATAERLRQSQVDLFLAEVRRSLPGPPPPKRLAELPSAWDGMYSAFEDVFRGPYDVVQERLRPYLGDVLALDRRGPVLDVGCGRGEWLELLADAGVDAYGIDSNRPAVERCLDRKLDVRCEEATEHQSSLSPGSVAVISAFHVAEHLSFDALLGFLDLSLRALQPGGLLVLETPNPDNLTVGASTFYLDPTHVRPLPAPLLSFLLSCRGFADVTVRYLRRVAGPPSGPSSGGPRDPAVAAAVAELTERVGGPEDYAVLGRRL